MSISKTILAIVGTLLVGVTTMFASARRPELKNKLVDLTRKKSVIQNRENLFI
jgi:hypothetical protein